MQHNFICFNCQQKPREFTILRCDHLICSTCLDITLQQQSNFSIIQCKCGMKTSCNQDSMMRSMKTPEMIQANRQFWWRHQKQRENQNTQISNFVIHQTDFDSKINLITKENDKENINSQNVNTHNLNTQNFNTQNQKYSFNPGCYYYNHQFLKTQPLNIEQSSISKGEKKEIDTKNKKNTLKGVRSIQSIKTMSPSQKISLVVSPFKSKPNQTPTNQQNQIYTTTQPNQTPIKIKKQKQKIHSSNMYSSTDSLNNLSKQLQRQLTFLSIQYQKQIETCQKTFKKIIKSITSSYQKVVSSMKKLYLQQIVEIQHTQKDQLILNLPQIIKKKYQSNISSKISKLNQRLIQYFDKYDQRKGSERQRPLKQRQTVFLLKDIQQKQNSFLSKTTNKKSQSKQSKPKPRQCALYIAVSPKQKNHKVVNYIEVIKKPQNKTKKGNLIKKTIKGDKIRIY